MSCWEWVGGGVMNGKGLEEMAAIFNVLCNQPWMRLLPFVESPFGLSSLVLRYRRGIRSHCLQRVLYRSVKLNYILFVVYKMSCFEILIKGCFFFFPRPRFSHPQLWCQSRHENICPPHLGFATELQIPSAFQGECQDFSSPEKEEKKTEHPFSQGRTQSVSPWTQFSYSLKVETHFLWFYEL